MGVNWHKHTALPKDTLRDCQYESYSLFLQADPTIILYGRDHHAPAKLSLGQDENNEGLKDIDSRKTYVRYPWRAAGKS